MKIDIRQGVTTEIFTGSSMGTTFIISITNQ